MMKYQKYDKYKDSEIEWLGYIPDSWTVRKIKWESPVYRGASPRPIEDPAYFDDEGEYAWVRISDVTASNTYLRETQQRLSDFGAGFSVKLQPGSLFLSIAGSVGKPCITAIKCCIHDGFVYFPKLKIENKFLYYIFASGEPYKGLGKMGTQLNLNTETVGSIQIPIPTPNEQNSIVEFLDRETTHIDTLIDKKQKLIELLKEKRTALITQAVTKGLNPDAKMKNSGIEWLGEVPEHWEVNKLKYNAKARNSNVDKNTIEGEEPVRLCNYVDVYYNKYITPDLELMTATATFDEIRKFQLEVGDVIITKDSESWDDIAIPAYVKETEQNLICGYHLSLIRTNNCLYDKFLYWLLMSRAVRSQLEISASGVTRYGLPKYSIDNAILPIPELEEQIRIVEFLDIETKKLDDLVTIIEQAIIKHQEYRTAIISAAVTGKIKVSQD